MPQDPFMREKFTRLRTAARKLAEEYFERFPKDRHQTEVESWRYLQSDNVEFVMKRLREPIDTDHQGG
jgi:DNA-directed RNA polymerase sigma subunit (sigma70/sigma32)